MGKNEISEWLKYAKHYLKDAEIRIEVGMAPPKLVFEDCQQALEWIIKAYLLNQKISFPSSHDLRKLSKLVEVANGDLARNLVELDCLSAVAGGKRYPNQFKEENFSVQSLGAIYARVSEVFERFLAAIPAHYDLEKIPDFAIEPPRS